MADVTFAIRVPTGSRKFGSSCIEDSAVFVTGSSYMSRLLREVASTMLTPIRAGAFRWSTPDPADRWMMVGHLLVRETGVVFIDPPLVPGLIEAASRLGMPEAVLLTTQNHTRGSRYISRRAGVPLYLPEQDPKFLDAKELVMVKEMGPFELYRTGSVLGFGSYKFGDDYALVSDKKELLVGDNATADIDGNVILMPGWLPNGAPYSDPNAYSKEDMDSIKKEFKRIVKSCGATSLLSSHGYDAIGNLQAQAENL